MVGLKYVLEGVGEQFVMISGTIKMQVLHADSSGSQSMVSHVQFQ